MEQRRNTLTAVLFLSGLAAAVVFLLAGVLPGELRFQTVDRTAAGETAYTHRLTSSPEEEVQEEGPAVTRTAARAVKNPGSARPNPIAAEDVDGFLDSAEANLNATLDRDHLFIEVYGGAQRVLGRQVVEDVDPQYTVVKLTGEMLTFANLDDQPVDTTTRGSELADFARTVRKKFHIPLLYVQAPSKLSVSDLPEGVDSSFEAEADQFLAVLEEKGVNTLDLRPAFREAVAAGGDVDELFFSTDHHWTPAGAFLGYQTLCERLEANYHFEIDERYTDPDSFQVYTVEDVFLGSQGKRVGSLYAGMDDIEIWSPTFSTGFTYSVPLSGIEREGPFAVSLLFPEYLTEKDKYLSNPYVIYSGGDFLLSRAYNEEKPDAPRVMVLRDSYGCAFTPFLSLVFGEVMAVDPRLFNGDQETMLDYIKWLKPDLIIVLNTTGSIRVDDLFPYLPSGWEGRQAALAAQAEE